MIKVGYYFMADFTKEGKMACSVDNFFSHFFLPLFFFQLLLLQQPFMVDSSRMKNTNALHESRGFSLDLVHRDSPHSPLHDPSSTRSQRMVAAFERSLGRHRYLSSRLSLEPPSALLTVGRRGGDIWSPVFQQLNHGGDFVMRLSLGTPPHTYWAILDTGSDLIWTQCLPCLDCYNQSAPLFDPEKSSSYKTLDCRDSFCNSLPLGHESCDYNDNCHYTYFYGDLTFSEGTLATETLTFSTTTHRTVKFPGIAFGCSHRASGLEKEGTPGIVGLAAGPLSLLSQLGTSVGFKFAYCLVGLETNKTGSLKFGDSAKFSGAGKVQRTPLKPSPDGILFILTLLDISVAGTRLNIQAAADPDGGAAGRGGGTEVVIDSGTTLTLLDANIYPTLEAALRKAVVKYPRVQPPKDVPFSLCYKVEDSGERFPDLVFHFEGGADWRLTVDSYMVSTGNGTFCLAIVQGNGLMNLFGNISQSNFHVEYDLQNSLLYFVPTDCSRNQ